MSFSERNYNDPAYKKWRLDVFKRDGFKCQYPGGGCTKRLHAHHIRRWAEHHAIRFNVLNGITLCKKHHDMVWGNEDNYIGMFTRIVINKAYNKRKKK